MPYLNPRGEVLRDAYADSIIGERSSDYNAIELHGVRNLNSENAPEGTNCEVDDENPEFYSVYAHHIEDGIECIGDFGEYGLAAAYADEVSTKYGWPVYDAIPKNLMIPSRERG